MVEGYSAEIFAEKFPLVSMGGWAEGLACADPGARTPIGASRINKWNILRSCGMSYYVVGLNDISQPELNNILWRLGTCGFRPQSPARFLFNISIFDKIGMKSGEIVNELRWIFGYCPLKNDKINWKPPKRINTHNISTKSPAKIEITWGQCPHVPK